ncbi:putative zinc finger protein [Ureibacillus xyleni]|uniref:Putative zinc finger protein n=1 Tax=Ureibacillus xyleni TaxID=614648 RepID=A0A285SNF2_9BACL|nr:DUF4179 domain-containing protein [Ureibacillus xyleni]SOC09504.1 putative zinc finger protein [Ureibacillus xyleni]
MNCVKADQLSQYVDRLLTEQENKQIEEHLVNCAMCKQIVTMLEEENDFLQETLKSPTLPEDFATNVLEQLEPYKQVAKPKKRVWNRMLITAAGVALAFGVSTTFSPSFAELIGGIFGKQVVDEGLKMANEAGFGERVNLSVTDKGLTFKIEDVIADTSRIALSYQVLNSKGIAKDPALNEHDLNSGNEITLYDHNGKKLILLDSSYSQEDGYALLEYSLRELPSLDSITVKFNLTELDGVKGNWQLEVPIDLKEISKQTKTYALQDEEFTAGGVHVTLDELKIAPTSADFDYETSFTKDELNKIENQLDALSNKLGENIIKGFNGTYETSLGYRIENANGDSIFKHKGFIEGKGHPILEGGLQGSGKWKSQIGHVEWKDSFIPSKNQEKLTFVLDGVFKTVPSDFSINIKPEKLTSFEFEGNHITVKDVKVENNLSLENSITPIKNEKSLKIEMEGSREAKASQIVNWVLVDEKGKAYEVNGTGEISDEKNADGFYKTKNILEVPGITEVPNEFTLYVVTVTQYEELDEKWKVHLNK